MPDLIGDRRRRGRPRGGASDARDRILAAAAAEFGRHGYDGATVRAIAEEADVDSALVHHYFGTKADLFAAVVDMPSNPGATLRDILSEAPDLTGELIVRFVVDTWEDPAFRTRGVAVLRAVIGNRRTSSVMVGFLSREILQQLSRRIASRDDADKRAALIASQVSGLIVTRYVLELPPLAGASRDEVVSAVAPTIERYLTGDL